MNNQTLKKAIDRLTEEKSQLTVVLESGKEIPFDGVGSEFTNLSDHVRLLRHMETVAIVDMRSISAILD